MYAIRDLYMCLLIFKCTGQPSPCEACDKIGLACHFDSKPNWKTRSRATYSAEDGRLQYLLNAVLNALKHSDERELQGLVQALRQNESPETVAIHLRNNMNILQEHGHISNTPIDQADLVSLASRIIDPTVPSAPTSESDSNIEIPPPPTETMDLDTSLSGTDGQTYDGDHLRQADSAGTRRYQSSAGPIQNIEFESQMTPDQLAFNAAWHPTQSGPEQTQNQIYYYDQLNYARSPTEAFPNMMHQPQYIGPHNALPLTISPNQYYPMQPNVNFSPPGASTYQFGHHNDEADTGSLSVLYEGLAARFQPYAPLPPSWQPPAQLSQTLQSSLPQGPPPMGPAEPKQHERRPNDR